MPTGLIVHPFDWEDVELAKGTDGHYLTIVTVDNAGLTRFFRLPVVPTASIAAGTALLGSFGRAAEIKDYQQAEIMVTDSHSDYFVKDIMAIKATERIGLAVYRPESFVEVTFDAAPS
jgi:HK97 family phage major capsid protein